MKNIIIYLAVIPTNHSNIKYKVKNYQEKILYKRQSFGLYYKIFYIILYVIYIILFIIYSCYTIFYFIKKMKN